MLVRLAFVVGAVAITGCQSHVARYVVSDTPIKTGVGHGQCIAVDPADRHGVWWWDAGSTGCSTRSTAGRGQADNGEGIMHAENAEVSKPTPSGAIAISFPIPNTDNTVVVTRLVLEKGEFRDVASGARVSTHRRNDLAVPFSCC